MQQIETSLNTGIKNWESKKAFFFARQFMIRKYRNSIQLFALMFWNIYQSNSQIEILKR